MDPIAVARRVFVSRLSRDWKECTVMDLCPNGAEVFVDLSPKQCAYWIGLEADLAQADKANKNIQQVNHAHPRYTLLKGVSPHKPRFMAPVKKHVSFHWAETRVMWLVLDPSLFASEVKFDVLIGEIKACRPDPSFSSSLIGLAKRETAMRAAKMLKYASSPVFEAPSLSADRWTRLDTLLKSNSHLAADVPDALKEAFLEWCQMQDMETFRSDLVFFQWDLLPFSLPKKKGKK